MKLWVSAVFLSLVASLGCNKTGTSVFNGYLAPNVPKDKPVSDESEVYDPRVDVLFVVDNSGSMQEHQRNLANNINLFLNEFLKGGTLDYHVGVITTDDGRLRGYPPFVDSQTPSAAAVLGSALKPGTNGSAQEKMFDPIYWALSPPLSTSYNSGFLRDGAYLAVIFISDAEDQSDMMDEVSLMNFLVQLKGGMKNKILAYGVIVPTATSFPRCARDEYKTPVRTERFLADSISAPNNIMELCAPDFGMKLAGLGSDLVKSISKVILLKHAPVLNTIRVTYGTQMIPQDYRTGWTYDAWRNAIVLGEEIAWSKQPKGTKVEVTFTPAHY